ncbi:MAG: HAMP domain-containing histidine kinase [Alphaproteobacteria bacterium]|nr:HAMP domain-containing histidine kinase [Alphaproteobacteria bacterium]
MPINAKPFRTSTFRLAALYLLFFVVSILAVLGYVYYYTVGLLERQNEETIRAEVTGLADQYRAQGLPGLTDAINRRIGIDSTMLFMLADPAGTYIAGNLHSPPIAAMPDDAWINFPIQSGDSNGVVGHEVHGYNVQLPQDYQLLVGQDVEDLNQFRNMVREALYWGLGLSVLMGFGGGFVMSRNFLRRVDEITATSRIIMNGNLSGRMPVSGSGDELDRLAQSLNDMLGQIEKLMQGMREVSSNVAHDLKTPLTRLRARIEAALRQNNKAEYQAALQQTLADSDQLLSTFNALLSITQLESGHQRSNLQLIDASEILEDVADLYSPLVEEGAGTLELDCGAGLQVKAKRELLAQATINLIDNAIKYGHGGNGAGAHIRVSGRREGKEVVLTVADDGPGIPAADRERVLQRFVRLDESRSKPGNGLGLSLVSSVANLLDGKIILKDNHPGLRAELRLPYAGAAS